MQAIYTMYIIPLFDSFKQAYYTVITVCVRVRVRVRVHVRVRVRVRFQLCTYTVLHMGPRPCK